MAIAEGVGITLVPDCPDSRRNGPTPGGLTSGVDHIVAAWPAGLPAARCSATSMIMDARWRRGARGGYPAPAANRSCLVAALRTAAGVDHPDPPGRRQGGERSRGAVSGGRGDWGRRTLRYVYIAGLLHFQQALALRMGLPPQYVAVNNKTE
ncbi:hypothetical protein ACTWLT_03445 [Micromonospora sp. ZYX-F-536]|uniref:hypothetical protein n=1 Tax=Micromonospora sp. ZYX-F-536 TaxID=3457629 RepID=UPI004040CA2E